MARPREPIIEVQRVVREALAMIDEGGMDGLSMRGLGKRLGVNPASLYHHFHNKDDILDAVRDYIIRKANISRLSKTKTWEEMLVTLGKSYRAAMTSHPKAAWLIAAHNPMRTRVAGHRIYDMVITALTEAGFTDQQAIYLMVGVETLASGSIIEEINFGRTIKFGQVDAEKNPALSAATRAPPMNLAASFSEMLSDFIVGAKARFMPAPDKETAPG